jgi:membrane protease YdiL (CAAX protease family)
MHFQGFETFGQWWVIIVTGSIGFILALIVLKTRRLGLAITTHVAFNSYAMILLTITQ